MTNGAFTSNATAYKLFFFVFLNFFFLCFVFSEVYVFFSMVHLNSIIMSHIVAIVFICHTCNICSLYL